MYTHIHTYTHTILSANIDTSQFSFILFEDPYMHAYIHTYTHTYTQARYILLSPANIDTSQFSFILFEVPYIHTYIYK